MSSAVNILIPFYNAEATLAQTLSSVERQTCDDWSVIFIDDGSADFDPRRIAQNFLDDHPGKGKLIDSKQPRSGPAIGRNQAIKNADALYVICLDSDDLLAPFCIEQRLSVMRENPDLDWAVFNQYQRAPNDPPPYKLFNRPAKTREEAVEYFLKMDTAWQTMAPIWKRETLLKLRGFDETLYPMEDPDIHLRALLDMDLKVRIMSDLPADCYYFVANKGEDRILAFYRESIKAKFRFLKKTSSTLPRIVTNASLQGHKKLLRKGFFYFINGFLLSRLKEHHKEFNEITKHLFNAKILFIKDVVIIKLITVTFTSDSMIIKRLRLRGLVRHLIFR